MAYNIAQRSLAQVQHTLSAGTDRLRALLPGTGSFRALRDRLGRHEGIRGMLAGEADHAAGGVRGATGSSGVGALEFPSFLQFFGSRYSLALLGLSLVINRIHAVVPPANQYRSKARVRALVRAPAIIALVRACFLIVGMLVSMSDSKEGHSPYYYTIRQTLQISQGTRHADVLWSCFVAVCIACGSESFVRALDHDLASITPVNLFTLGLLLHFHSTPASSPVVPPTQPVYVLLLLTLLEILALHLAAIPAWRVRLWITGSFALVSRSLMVYFWLRTPEKTAHTALMPAIQSLGRILPEAFFVGCSLITIVLRAMVQLITEGTITRSIFGHSSSLPHRDDDFILAIIKYGTATLETTAMKGLNNEVSALMQPPATYVELHHFSQSSGQNRTANVLMQHPSLPDHPQLAQSQHPLDNEVKQVNVTSGLPTDVDPMSRNSSLRKEIWRFCKALWLLWKIYISDNLAQRLGIRRLARGNGKVAKMLRLLGVTPIVQRRPGVAQDILAYILSRKTARNARPSSEEVEDDANDLDWVDEQEGSSEDDDGDDASSSDSDESAAGDSSTGEDVILSDTGASRESTPLHSTGQELVTLLQQEEQQDLAPVLIAHLQAGLTSSSPLTRRRYNAMLQGPAGTPSPLPHDAALTTAIATRRRQSMSQGSASQSEWDEANFRTPSLCVVCCAEHRSIVLWPCRCLALCNDCRTELAARSTGTGGSNLCPCCRSEVQGYSRIHIP